MSIKNVRIWHPETNFEVTAQVDGKNLVGMLDSKHQPMDHCDMPLNPELLLATAHGQYGLGVDFIYTRSGDSTSVLYFLEE